MIVNRPEDRVKVMVLDSISHRRAVILYLRCIADDGKECGRRHLLPHRRLSRQRRTHRHRLLRPRPEANGSSTNTNAAISGSAPRRRDTTNDPFKPPAAPPATAAQLVAAGTIAKPPTGVPPASISNLTAASIVRPNGLSIGPTIAGPAVNGAAASSLTLQGVVLADRAVGVFRASDETFYKHVGDTVVDNLVLKKVTDGGVLLARGKQLFALEIGHSDMNPSNGSVPAPSKSAFGVMTLPNSALVSDNRLQQTAPEVAINKADTFAGLLPTLPAV